MKLLCLTILFVSVAARLTGNFDDDVVPEERKLAAAACDKNLISDDKSAAKLHVRLWYVQSILFCLLLTEWLMA
jgi:hypothetical protein